MRPDKAPLLGIVSLGLVCIFSPSGCHGQAASTIAIDAATKIIESNGGDDLATLQNIFQDANAPQDGTIDPMSQIIADLRLKRMRILAADVYCDLDASGSFGNVPIDASGHPGAVVPGDCDLLAEQINWALSNRLAPHVALASSMPLSFVQYGPAETWSADTLARYKSYVSQLVSYVVRKSFDAGAPNGGASSVIFEISNEIDIADPTPVNFYAATPPDPSLFALLPLGAWGRFLWWIDPATYNLREWPIVDANSYPYSIDLRRLEHGIAPLQKIFADQIAAIRNDPQFQAAYPGKTVEIAGPAFAGVSFHYYPLHALPTLEERFLDQMLDPSTDVDPATGVARFNTSLDRFSFHFYGDFQNGWDANAARYTTLKYLTDTIGSKLTALGHPATPLFLSEWGPSADSTSDINYSHKGAAWAAAFLTEAVHDKIGAGSFLMMHDGIGSQPGMLGMASLMYKAIASDGSVTYHPKPPANVFKMFAMMSGTRDAIALPTDLGLGAFAANDATSAGVVVYNYDSTFTDTAKTFSVEFDNLPFDGTVTVRRYLVDASTSNLAAFLSQPGQPDPSLQMVEQFSAEVQNGQLVLSPRSLGLGVTFWQVLN
ncbi:hypothetical protein [Bradyrhizobium sp.]|uniref:hypothetical protein n=1 Tax=Bradyrhizobium sp. TaxID=376 RepID=UPI001ED77A98|nr:hypothetical protein [Bradyrhizobium sp.]MBV8918205.1 hypothetical protein [Bradyrhizobium sp.]MBV9979807.1 hypothetical protein [Bradyrhizobium sp.]